MLNRFRPLAGFVAASILAGSSALGGVKVVDFYDGPGADFTSMQSAVDAASDGDILRVRTGTHPSLTIANKSLTIQADAASFGRRRQLVAPIVVPDLGPGIDAVGVIVQSAFCAPARPCSLASGGVVVLPDGQAPPP